MIWIVSFLQHSRLQLYFADIGQTGSIFPLSLQMQFNVWASRGEAVENWYSHTITDVWRIAHFHTHSSQTWTQTNKHIYSECFVCTSVMYYSKYVMFDSFVEVYGERADWLASKGAHCTREKNVQIARQIWSPILIGLSSVTTTCFTWQTCKHSHTTSLCTPKAHHRLLSIIPNQWHDCTPLYSRPNYPGPL